MSDPHKLPVEPLSEKRWEAIERGVLDRLDAPAERAEPRGRRIPVLVLGIAASLAVAAALAFAMLPATSAPAANRLASTRIATELASAETSLGEVSVTLAAHSELTAVGGDSDGWLVVLEHGTATFEVPPRRERPSFVVQAGSTRVEVVGTRFTVSRTESVSVSVDHGRVRVLDGAREWELEDGGRWPVEVTSASPDAVVSVSTPGAPDALGEPEAMRAPVRAPEVARLPEAPRSLPSARERFDEAASLEARRPDDALALYAALESEGGPWAANALFARGRLASELGRRSIATAALERYLDRHPDGPNAEDARALLAGTH